MTVTDNQFILDYFRLSADHRLLLGGKCTYTGQTPRKLAQSMRARILRVFPQLHDVGADYAWGGHIDIPLKRPRLQPCRPDLLGAGLLGPRHCAQLRGRIRLAQAILGNDRALQLFETIPHHRFPGDEKLAGLMQVAGMSYYRLRGYF